MRGYLAALANAKWRLLALLLLAAAGAAHAACDELAVEDAWIRSGPPGQDVMAAYFELQNSGDATVRVTGISSPQFEHAELHRSLVDDSGMATMEPVQSISLAPGEQVAFEPGGYHAMLFVPADEIQAGDRVSLALSCAEAASAVEFDAEVRSMMPGGDAADHGHMHEHR